VHEPVELGEVQTEAERLPLGFVPGLHDARFATQLDGAPVDPVLHVDSFDSGDRARCEEGEHRVPREGWAVRHAELEAAIGDAPIGKPPPCAQLEWRKAEDVLHHAVHLAHAVEPGRVRDVADRKVGVIEESAGEMRTARARDFRRRRTDVGLEQAAQVAGTDPEPPGQFVFGRVVEEAVADATHCSTHELGRIDPVRLEFAVGAAAQARPEPGGFSRGSKGVGPHILLVRRAGTAHRSAIDPGRHDGAELRHNSVLGQLE
jgi:hypothetical protein